MCYVISKVSKNNSKTKTNALESQGFICKDTEKKKRNSKHTKKPLQQEKAQKSMFFAVPRHTHNI